MIYGKHKEIYKLDIVLSDYLEAEINSYIMETPKLSQGQELHFKEKEDEKKVPEHQRPWDLAKKKDGNSYLTVIFGINDNKIEEKRLHITDYPRTALAAARIFLIELYFAKDKEGVLIKNIDTILKKVEKKMKKITCQPGSKIFTDDEMYNYEFLMDWLRLKWNYIYYNASRAAAEPLEKYRNDALTLYNDVWKYTVKVIKNYLEEACGDRGFCLDSDWLMAFLASNLLLSNRINCYYNFQISKDTNNTGKVNDNPLLLMRYLKYLSHHILYVLHCARHARRKRAYEAENSLNSQEYKRFPFVDVPIDPTSSLSMSLLYLLSEYAYREIGVNRELHILEKLSRQLYFELPLHAASGFYRDHLYHVMDVCLLGEFFLKNILFSKSPGNTITGTMLNDILITQPLPDLLKNWYIAALYHDLGYVIEQTDKFLGPIDEIEGDGISNFSERLKEGLKSGEKEIREIIEKIVKEDSSIIPRDLQDKLLDHKLSTDHGIIGWLHLRHRIKEIKEPIESFAPSLVAILRHNLSDQEIDIYKEPLSFLLLLCDHLQEWGRPRVAPDPLAQGIMENLRFSEQPMYDRKIRMREMIIYGLHPQQLEKEKIPAQMCDNCVSMNTEQCEDLCLKIHPNLNCEQGITFILPHQEAREADFEPCISWLIFCRDFQCISRECFSSRKKPMPFPISIQFEHMPPRIWRELSWKPMEMDIFEEYSSTYPPAAYLCEWIESARNNREGVSYSNDRNNGEEKFIIHLHKLGKPLKHGLSEEHWKYFYTWKWNWLGRQYLTSNLGSLFPGEES
jgi:hypothetical protein